jgi:hypothetical protein
MHAADQAGRIDQRRIAPADFRVLPNAPAGYGRADAQAVGRQRQLVQFRNALAVNHQTGLAAADAHVDDQVGTAGQYAGIAVRAGQQRHRLAQ